MEYSEERDELSVRPIPVFKRPKATIATSPNEGLLLA